MRISDRKKKQLLAMILLSALAAIVLIAHGVIFDLDIRQLSRLSVGGFFITMPAVFIGLLTLEWVFDLD